MLIATIGNASVMLGAGKYRFRIFSGLFHVYVGGLSMLGTISKLGVGIITGAILIKEIKEVNTIYDKYRSKVLKKLGKICSVKPIENAD